MILGQVIHFDDDQKNTLYRFFYEKEQVNSNGEDFVQVFLKHYSGEDLSLDLKHMPITSCSRK